MLTLTGPLCGFGLKILYILLYSNLWHKRGWTNIYRLKKWSGSQGVRRQSTKIQVFFFMPLGKNIKISQKQKNTNCSQQHIVSTS